MAWTTPKTWSSEPLTSVDLNTYVRDNQNHLYDRLENHAQYTLDESSDYQTTSTSFVDVDATNLALTITTHGGDVLVGLVAGGHHTVASEKVYFTVAVDGSDAFGDDGVLVCQNESGYRTNMSFVAQITGLTAGSHTFKLQWKVSNGNTGRLYAGAAGFEDIHPQFWVQEL